MLYEFRRVHRGGKLGDYELFEYDMGTAPGFGEKMRRGGKTYQRTVPAMHEDQIHVDSFMDDPFVSRSLPLNYEPHKQAGGRFDAKGHPVFESKRQVQATERAARNFSEHDNIQHPGLKPFRSRT